MNDDFLLHGKIAKVLYHDYAAKMPICDFHCHLPAEQIAADHQFKNITEIWLYGDHYKWRAMRTGGVDEKFCTGDAGDWEKFEKWAQTVPYTIRNPLYHWTHLELKRPFGITGIVLNPSTARRIWDICNEKLQSREFSCRNLLRYFDVRVVITTDDPLSELKAHAKIADDKFEIKVLPTWRPDKAMATGDIDALNAWIDRLAEMTGIDISSFDDYIGAIRKRHDFFGSMGCRISDHGLDTIYADHCDRQMACKIFDVIRQGGQLDESAHRKFRSIMLYELAVMDAEKGWVQQFHIGAMRNNNSRMFKKLGPDTGFDSIGDEPVAYGLSRFLDRLDAAGKLAKTILYNLNPRDNALMATMLGNFQDGSVPGKMQWGSGWWFMDQKKGMQDQMNELSAMGLLSRFVGMVTDSRSFLSYTRHEYFRRILCNLLGEDVDKGLIPRDIELLGQMVQDISYNNAMNYLGMKIQPQQAS